MTEDTENLAEWVDDFHEQEREDQTERMEWLHNARPEPEGGHVFHGGLTASNLYEEAQQAYLFGLFQTCTITSISVIEQELIGVLHQAGDDDIKEEAAAAAIDEAADRNLISAEQKQVLHRIRKVRNPTAHFRLGVDDDSLPYRAIEEDTSPAELVEDEARIAMNAMFRVIGRVDGGTTGGAGSRG